MRTSKTLAILAASYVGIISLPANAAPLMYYSITGRISGSGGAYTPTVTVSAGQVVDLRFEASFAPVGTSNVNYTISAITSADGFNNTPVVKAVPTNTSQINGTFVPTIVVDTSDPDVWVTETYAGTLATGWNQGTAFSPGTLVDGTIDHIKAIRAPGSILSAVNPVVAFRSTYAITSVTGTRSLIQLGYGTDPSPYACGFQVHVNNMSSSLGFPIMSGSETGPNPFVKLNGLTLVAANSAPVFATGSGLSSGDTGIDATLDLIYPLNLQTHVQTFTIADSLITDEAVSSTTVTLGPGALSGVNAPLAGHMSMVGRNIVISGNYLDVQSLLGTYAIPLMLTDSQGSSSNGTFALQIVPEPLGTGLLGLGGLSLLRRRRRLRADGSSVHFKSSP